MNTKGRRKSNNVIDTRTPEGAKKHRADMNKISLDEKTSISSHLRDKTPIKDQNLTPGEKKVSELNKTLPFLKERSAKNLLNDDTFSGSPKQTFSHQNTQVTPGTWKQGKI